MIGPMPAKADPLEVLPTGHPVGEVYLEGEGSFRFIINTAATSTVLLPRIAGRFPSDETDAVQVDGASGAVAMEVVTLSQIAIASVASGPVAA